MTKPDWNAIEAQLQVIHGSKAFVRLHSLSVQSDVFENHFYLSRLIQMGFRLMPCVIFHTGIVQASTNKYALT